ncbi:hypothetical protein [Nocardia tengchongensis]|uniref:hypothetical protein n=1 Tax=Nocardia tengchongensis TaxID=2055889 RepID=UPI0036228CAA
MPDEDCGDDFLRHRTAVLDALLADPALGRTTKPDTKESVGEFDLGPDPSTADPAFGGSTVAAPDPGAGGPKASERILALLNGQTGDNSAGLDLSGVLSAPGSAKSAPDNRTEPEPPRRTTPPRSDRARELVAVIRKPKAVLAIGAALTVVVIVALLVSAGESSPPAAPVYATAAPTSAGTAAAPNTTTTTTTTSAAAALQVKSAQSHCPPGGTPAMDAFAGPGKAWSCARAYKVDGQVLTIDLGGTYQVESIGIVPGWDAIGADGVDQWTKYRTASRISYRFDDANATIYTQQTLDQRSLVVTKMSPPVSASRITVTVLASKGDPTVNITALSSIVIEGH